MVEDGDDRRVPHFIDARLIVCLCQRRIQLLPKVDAALQAAWSASSAPATRTSVAVEATRLAMKNMRALAVPLAKRIAAEPDLPTVMEAGVPGYEATLWHGLIGPKGLPRPIVDRINAEAGKALKVKETAAQLQNDGVAPAGGTPEQFAAQIKKEIGVWRKVAADAGVKAE